MGSARTGAPFRGLRDNETGAGVARDVLLVSALLLAGGVATAAAVHELLPSFDREHPMHTLRETGVDSTGEARIAATGHIHTTAGDEPSLCVIRHESADGATTRFVVNSNAAFQLADGGREFPLRAEHIQFEPHERWLFVRDDQAVRWRSKLPRLPAKGRVHIRCFDHDEPVFIDAPLGRDEAGVVAVHGTAGDPLIATLADSPRARVGWLALQHATGLPALGIGGLLLLYLGWLLLRARWLRRAWLRSWARSASFPLLTPVRFILVVIVLAVASGLAVRAWGDGFKYWSGLVFALFALLTAWAVLRHRRSVAVVGAHYLEATRKLIAEARGKRLALHVTVASDAPTIEAPLSGEPRAFWSFTLRKLAVGGGGAVFHASSATQVPVADDAGQGMIDLDGALLDLPVVRKRIRRGSDGKLELDERVAELLPDDLEAELAEKRNVFFMEESSLMPGDQLSLYGDMTVELSRSAGESYRGGTEEVPVVKSAAAGVSRLLAVAGPPETMARLARGQMAAMALIATGGVGLAALLAGLVAFLMTR